MPFRVKIISPIRVDQADLERRQRRYSAEALPDTQVQVFNLSEGPSALNDEADMRFCESAVLQEGSLTSREEFDAILIDCVFDPSVEAIAEQSTLPTFGPMRTTLALVDLVAPRFSIVARAPRQCEMLAELVREYGYGDRIASTRALDLTYPEARQPALFNAAMRRRLRKVVEEDGADAVVMGSTTMAIDPEVAEAAGGAPLFLPGMVALGVMEQLWRQNLLNRRG